jgi:hypothetical protein
MFGLSACAKVRVADVHVDLAALTHIAVLLRRALNDRFTSSNAPLSGVRLPLPVNQSVPVLKKVQPEVPQFRHELPLF